MIEPCKPLSVSMTGYGRELLSGPLIVGGTRRYAASILELPDDAM
jgi:hypothetical protein